MRAADVRWRCEQRSPWTHRPALTADLPPASDPRRPDLDPLARGVEIRPARLSLLPARRGARAGGHQHRRGGAGLAGAPAGWVEHGAGRRALGVADQAGPEAEHADCLVADLSARKRPGRFPKASTISPGRGSRTACSSSHVRGEWIDAAADAMREPATQVAAHHASRLTPDVSRFTFDV